MTKEKIFIVTKLDKDKIISSLDNRVCHTYNFQKGRINRETTMSLNDAKKLHQLAYKEKSKYVDFIYSTNQFFLKNDIIFNQNLSLYFLSIHSNKRSDIFSTYTEYLHQLMIRDILKSNNYETFYTIGFSKEEILKLEINLGVKFKTAIPPKTNHTKKIRNAFNFFYLFSFFYLILIKLLFKKKRMAVDKFYFAQFPKHFNYDFSHKKYGSLLKNKGSLFLLTLLSDGFHQNLKPISFIISIVQLLKKSNSESYILLDQHLSLRDLFWAIRFHFNLKKKFKKLDDEKFIINGIDLSYQLIEEFRLAKSQIPRLLMYYNAYRTVFDQFSPRIVTYYLHEFVFGRFLSYVLKTYYPKIISHGFQHGTMAELKLRYALSSNEVLNEDYLQSVPLPQKNYCENEFAKMIYNSNGYPNLEIQPNVERLIYLKTIKRNNIHKGTCLIACGLHDPKQIMQYVIDKKIYLNKKIWFKLHPMTKPNLFQKIIDDLNTTNICLATKPLTFYFERAEEVIVTYSSVGEEAIELGIKTGLLVFDYSINESSLMNQNKKLDKRIINYINY